MPTFVAASTPSFRPSSSDLPGTDVLEHLADGIFFWALIACGLGVVIGGVMWAFGHYSGNYQQSYSGRKGVLVSGLSAVLIGAAPTIIAFFNAQGHGVRP